MWEASQTIGEVCALAAQTRLNWVVQTILDAGESSFDGLKYHSHVFDNGLQVDSPTLGVLYQTEVDANGEHRILVFHPGPWVDRALAEAQRIEDEQAQKLVANFTPVDF
jgi:hypothetical protein